MPMIPATTSGKPEWVKIAQTFKQVQHNEQYVMGHTDTKMPAIVSSSNIKGVKGRLVTVKKKNQKGPPGLPSEKDLKVIHEWEFDEDNQTKPIYFSPPKHMDTDFWVEMINPNKENAVVNALVHGLYRSNAI